MTSFEGQTVIVTGAASGIGLGVALGFHDAGANVVLVISSKPRLTRPSPRRVQGSPDHRRGRCPWSGSDRPPARRHTAARWSCPGHGRKAVIVPNAAMIDMDVASWDTTIETNLRGAPLV
ncbi:MAG TPA: SDR family NAD(P)-dependent oxidoreductase [Thermomicrobiales bacterium]|nr:SDR family NAD(P)-dependent oxidoreductase [Thermomicrobiales bacterium]